jgi:hypothetical protein
MTNTCARCGRVVVDAEALAAQAEAVIRAVSGALSVVQGGTEVAYGGAYGLRRAIEDALAKADALALEHAHAAACHAGSCTQS